MKVDKISFSQSAISRNVIDMFLYIAAMEHYIGIEDYDVLSPIDVSVWKNVKKIDKDYTMLDISDFILDTIGEWREKNER